MENANKKSSRRRFLKTSAIAGTGSAAGAVAVNVLSPYVLSEDMVFETNRSYWAKALPAVNPSLRQDIEADVAVIGGGFTGLSAAYYLRKDGMIKGRVVLLEAERCGNGASGRNGAMMLTSTADRYMQWTNSPELDKRIYDLTAENIRKLKERKSCGSARNAGV